MKALKKITAFIGIIIFEIGSFYLGIIYNSPKENNQQEVITQNLIAGGTSYGIENGRTLYAMINVAASWGLYKGFDRTDYRAKSRRQCAADSDFAGSFFRGYVLSVFYDGPNKYCSWTGD